MTRGVRAVVLWVIVAVPACGGASSGDSSDGGESASGGATASGGTPGTGGSQGSGGTRATGGMGGARLNDCGKTSLSTPEGRPTSPVCSLSEAAANWQDAGAMSCKTSDDCRNFAPCVHGACAPDECNTDGDCAEGFGCACAADYYGGNGIHGNLCVPAQCRVDADCKAPGVCSPTLSGACRSLVGYYCHSPADTCNTDADCCADTSRCEYQPALGHWSCTAEVGCSG